MAGAIWGAGAASDLGQPIIARVYGGNQQLAAWAFQQDAARLAAFGYTPVAQQYVPGSWGTGAFLVGIVAILFFGFGLLILAYLVVVKPDGSLNVTYRLSAPAYTAPDRQVFPVGGR